MALAMQIRNKEDVSFARYKRKLSEPLIRVINVWFPCALLLASNNMTLWKTLLKQLQLPLMMNK